MARRGDSAQSELGGKLPMDSSALGVSSRLEDSGVYGMTLSKSFFRPIGPKSPDRGSEFPVSLAALALPFVKLTKQLMTAAKGELLPKPAGHLDTLSGSEYAVIQATTLQF